MLSNLTEIMCLIEETGDSTHVRAGRGSWGLPHPKFWATPLLRLFFILSLSRRGKVSSIHLRSVSVESNSEQYL